MFADGPDYTWYVIEEPELATGRMMIAEFGSDGSVRDSIVRRAWNMGQVMNGLWSEFGPACRGFRRVVYWGPAAV